MESQLVSLTISPKNTQNMVYKVAGVQWTPSTTSQLISNTRISDISLAAFGRKEIQIAEVGIISALR
jgi:hypothetical protein